MKGGPWVSDDEFKERVKQRYESSKRRGQEAREAVARILAKWQMLYDALCKVRAKDPTNVKDKCVMAAMLLDVAWEARSPSRLVSTLREFMRLYSHDAQILQLEVRKPWRDDVEEEREKLLSMKPADFTVLPLAARQIEANGADHG